MSKNEEEQNPTDEWNDYGTHAEEDETHAEEDGTHAEEDEESGENTEEYEHVPSPYTASQNIELIEEEEIMSDCEVQLKRDDGFDLFQCIGGNLDRCHTFINSVSGGDNLLAEGSPYTVTGYSKGFPQRWSPWVITGTTSVY